MAIETGEHAAAALGKSLLPRHVAMISIGGIIGAGLFVGSSAAISAIGPAVVISYAIAGLVVVLVMRMLGEMAAARPDIGSFTEYARLGLGDWAGFVGGWLYWYFWVVVVAIEAIAGAVILKMWLPFEVWQIGLGLMAVLTGTNLLSTRSFGEFEFWFASIKVAAIVAFIVIVGSFALGFTGVASNTVANLFDHGGFAPFGPLSVLAGVTTVVFSLCGAEITTIAAAESAAPGKAIARMSGSVIVRILLFYMVSIFLVVCVVPWTEIQPGESPFALALERVNIPAAALIMNLIVLTAVLSCLNSGVYVTSRVLFTLAARGDAPQWVVAVDKRGVPARAIWTGSLFAYLAVIASVLSPSLVFAFLVNASGALMLIIYLLIGFAQIRLRRQHERVSVEPLPLRMWLFPWASYFAIATIVILLAAMSFRFQSRIELLCSLGCTALVTGAFFATRNARSRWLARPDASS